jgi:hypothetical protein
MRGDLLEIPAPEHGRPAQRWPIVLVLAAWSLIGLALLTDHVYLVDHHELMGVSLVGVPPQQAGGAAGTLATGQQLAAACGVAALGEVFFSALCPHPALDRYLSALQHVLLLDVGLLAVSLVLVGQLPRAARRQVQHAAIGATGTASDDDLAEDGAA